MQPIKYLFYFKYIYNITKIFEFIVLIILSNCYIEKQEDFIENPVTFVTDVTDSEMPEFLPTAEDDARDTLKGDELEYPTQPCYTCGCTDYWLTDWNQWLCSRCHPKPEGK